MISNFCDSDVEKRVWRSVRIILRQGEISSGLHLQSDVSDDPSTDGGVSIDVDDELMMRS